MQYHLIIIRVCLHANKWGCGRKIGVWGDNHLLTHLESGTTYSIVIVGTSDHFFSEEVENPISITLSK